MASRVRFAAIGLGTLLSTAVVWSGCNESRNIEEEEAGSLTDLRSTLQLEIQSAEFPETGNPTVTFRATDQNDDPIEDFIDQAWAGARPLQPGEQRTAPYVAPPRFVVAQLLDSGDYLDVQERVTAGRPFVPAEGDDPVQPPAPPEGGFKQAIADQPPTTDEAAFRAKFVSRGNGVYTYTLGPPTVTEGIDRTKTFTAAMWATRNTLREEGATAVRASPANATFNFVPAGGGTAAKDEVVLDQACNACHGVMSAHDNRTGVQLCITCHSPQTTDPETGNTVDFKVMVHKIHNGSGLPSVAEGAPYRIVGFAGGVPADQPLPPSSVHDWSGVAFPRPVQNCTACHQGEDGAAYKTRPAAVSCGSCHDNVRFDATTAAGLPSCAAEETTAPCAHVGLPGLDLTNCSDCHSPEVIDAQHTVAGHVEAGQYRYEVVSVEVPADRRPVVTFRVVNPANGIPYNLRTHPTWTQAANGNSRLFVNLAFPSQEYENVAGEGDTATRFGQPVAIPIVTGNPINGVNPALEDAADGAYRIVSPVALPAGVASGAVLIEGHPAVAGGPTEGTRIPVTSEVEFFGADGPAQPRRDVVSVESCNACHGVISAHGNNRNNSVQACAVCHNANATDKSRVPAGTAGETPIDLKWMVHAIHAGEIREAPVTIYGFGGTAHQFPLPVPFDVGDCNLCHVNESWRVPIADVALGTTVSTGADPALASDNTRDPATASACLSCHEGRQNEALGVSAREHALTYVQADGTETCQQCHGTGGIADVARAHPIREHEQAEND
jgi:OmcA/MtrC family decaheme c-type cytochrome